MACRNREIWKIFIFSGDGRVGMRIRQMGIKTDRKWIDSKLFEIMNITMPWTVTYCVTFVVSDISYPSTLYQWVISSSAKYKSVQKVQENLPDTPVNLTIASKYFHICPAPPGAEQCALGLSKSILRWFWNQIMLWRWIQDAMGFNL